MQEEILSELTRLSVYYILIFLSYKKLYIMNVYNLMSLEVSIHL